MAAKGMPRDQVLQLIGEEDARAVGNGSTFLNVEAALRMLSTDHLTYRRRVFRVRPVGGPAGLRLYDIQQQLAHLQTQPWTMDTRVERLTRLLELTQAALAECNQLVSPATLFDRATWWIQRRWFPPFNETTNEAELADLLAFFSVCRMKSNVGTRGWVPGGPQGTPAPQTKSPTQTSWPPSGPPPGAGAGART
jgi:hypothetical protein